ncbi:ThiF family adenylyltransferase [Goodfellowiella coeruleoviolacea]|uniref:Bacteriocin biosynthesis cyclodehydratase domain-containing protein n=1 Tax=Goodfellowiella coeruleoviolacea TaxID=334858 RepID=A0AAE3KIZ4_9PSEU|nr:hypothetical protein [Goodfellowiella coeruleoviolacea]MCP2167899.1 bacteriocin biosynthesis cyclodehydratase domain-containing protein [Goodfellowiella coeruleoviolacea]
MAPDRTDQQREFSPVLPHRPRILPGLAVLHRNSGEVQIGTDPRHAVVIDGLTEPLVQVLRELDGRHTVDELSAQVAERGGAASELPALLLALANAGLLTDAAPAPEDRAALVGRLSADVTACALHIEPSAASVPARAQTRVVVHGNGRLTVAVAALLAAAGVGWINVHADGQVRAEDTGGGYLDADVGRPRQEAALAAVHRASCVVRTDRMPASEPPDLVVLADALVPCPQLVATLVADQVPHLLVRVREGTGLVGPLVVPGRSSCVRCADLHRCDRDARWSVVAAQLADRTQLADLATAHATASLAVSQALLALSWPAAAPAPPPTWNATLELDPWRGLLNHRPWPPHPNCGCGARDNRQPDPPDR